MAKKIKPRHGMRPMVTKTLAARILAFDAMQAMGGKGNTKMVKNGYGKLDAFRRPGSQKR